MKKILFRLIVLVLILAVIAVVGIGMFLDSVIKRGVETLGPMLTKVEVKLDSVSLSLLSGSGKIKGLMVGNPEGYKTPSAINVGAASLALSPASLLSDKIVIKSIEVQGPEITFETDLKGNNLSKILANLEAATGGGAKEPAQPKEAKPPKKLEVDDFKISGGKIHVSITALGGKSGTVPLPPIHLENLGKGSDGITGAELAKVVLKTLIESATKEATSAVADIEKGAVYMAKDLEGPATTNVNKAAKGITDLFKKK
jgi:uncharacterized protein involved in outer membrane biogenesis